MLIWRNLDPQLLGRLLAHAAETRAAERRARRGQPINRDLCRADATADQASRPGGRPSAASQFGLTPLSSD